MRSAHARSVGWRTNSKGLLEELTNAPAPTGSEGVGGRAHLLAQNLAGGCSSRSADVPDVDAVAGHVGRTEEGEALDVIPVQVAEEQVGVDPSGARRPNDVAAKGADACACIEDQLLARDLDGDA